ncbi:hypothetical protein Tco_0587182, partial [Tanacetum coccineum]
MLLIIFTLFTTTNNQRRLFCDMAADAAMKHMALNFVKLDKFLGVDFRRWQKKMYFLLSSMSVV